MEGQRILQGQRFTSHQKIHHGLRDLYLPLMEVLLQANSRPNDDSFYLNIKLILVK